MLTKQEFYRQLFHLGVGLLVIVTYYYNILSPLAVFLMLIVGGLASLLCKRIRLPFFSFFLDHFERKEVRCTFPGRGMLFFFVGVLLVMQLFEKDIALAAIMILSLGDSFSHIIGERFGHIKNIFNGKSRKLFEGTVAGTFFGFLGALIFVPLGEALVGSFVAMIIEVIDIDLNGSPIDDNLLVPLAAGTTMFLLRAYFGI